MRGQIIIVQVKHKENRGTNDITWRTYATSWLENVVHRTPNIEYESIFRY